MHAECCVNMLGQQTEPCLPAPPRPLLYLCTPPFVPCEASLLGDARSSSVIRLCPLLTPSTLPALAGPYCKALLSPHNFGVRLGRWPYSNALTNAQRLQLRLDLILSAYAVGDSR